MATTQCLAAPGRVAAMAVAEVDVVAVVEVVVASPSLLV
jgi:hypothetical protein